MIVCGNCGATNDEGRQFCASCREFLWAEGATPPPPGPAPATSPGPKTDRQAPAPGPDHRSAAPASGPGPDRQTTVPSPGPGPDRQGTDRQGTDRQGTEAGARPAREAPAPAPPPPDRPRPAAAAGAVDRPHPATVPGAVDRPDVAEQAGGQPLPVQPGLVARTRDRPDGATAPVDAVPRPPEADRVCPRCARSNPPDRRICRFCGAPLAATVVAEPQRSWWRRLWDRLRGRSPRRAPRKDRRAAGAARRSLLIVLALCLVGVLAVAGPPLARRAVEAVRDRTQDPASLVPTAVSASSERVGAGAARLTDGANNRYWAPTGTAVGSWVEGRFAEPVRLLAVVIHSGVGPRRQAFLEAGRPRGLTVVTVDAEGGQEKTDIELRDEPGEQHFDVEASNVVRIRLVVRSTYGSGLDPAVAIGEAEFFGRR
ncbi:NADase-type glycan-binding domain-containing protein [Micromonospora okii]|uniref:NADase-type glycan-binding domain-containing protein n=1 Tax=Micromonospora okii TaxID=1182970 RepID=UPI001E4257C7|nr:hypothetical protein [Micromonospora okii]